MNSLYNRFNSMFGNTPLPSQSRPQPQQNNNPLNLLAQIRQIQQNPGIIADILLQNGKITQQQYKDIQPFKNNPQQVAQYLINNGHANEINQAQQQASNLKGI